MNLWKLLIGIGVFFIACRVVMWVMRVAWFISGVLTLFGICLLIAGLIWYYMNRKRM